MSRTPNGLASLDIKSLFTNIPLAKTINIITEWCYNHPRIRRPKIPKNLLKELLYCALQTVCQKNISPNPDELGTPACMQNFS